MASIINKGGKYQVQIRRQGKRPVYKSFTDKRTAQAWARKIESEIEQGIFQDHSLSQTTTLKQVMERYKREILPSKRSQASIRSQIKLIGKELGSLSLSGVTSSVLSEYRNTRLRNVAPETVRKDLSFLQRLFNTAIKDWGINLPHGNPVEKVRFPSPPPGRSRRPTSEELTKLEADKTIGAYVILAVETGMRRGEIANIHTDHITTVVNKNKEVALLSIPETKTDIPRIIPLPERAQEAIRAILRRKERYPLLRADSISQAFERACKRYTIQGLRFHDLRHEATSRFFEMGLNPMEVAAISGHQDLKMLKRYTHIKPEHIGNKLISLEQQGNKGLART